MSAGKKVWPWFIHLDFPQMDWNWQLWPHENSRKFILILTWKIPSKYPIISFTETYPNANQPTQKTHRNYPTDFASWNGDPLIFNRFFGSRWSRTILTLNVYCKHCKLFNPWSPFFPAEVCQVKIKVRVVVSWGEHPSCWVFVIKISEVEKNTSNITGEAKRMWDSAEIFRTVALLCHKSSQILFASSPSFARKIKKKNWRATCFLPPPFQTGKWPPWNQPAMRQELPEDWEACVNLGIPNFTRFPGGFW